MRVLFTTFASKSHLYNMVQLAWALRAAGHDVLVASQPDIVDAITNAGLTAIGVGNQLTTGGDWRDRGAQNLQVLSNGLAAPAEEQRRRGWEHVLGELTMACGVRYESMADQAMVDDLVKVAVDWQPDLVVWDALTFAGPIAARACGAAHARMLFGMDLVHRLYADYVALRDQQPPEQRDDPLADWFAGRLSRIGQEYEPGMALELLTGQWSIDNVPAWMQPPSPLPRVPVWYIPFNGRITVDDWVHRAPAVPRVCMSFGVSMREHLGGTVVPMADLLGGIADLDVEVIATLDASQVDPAAVPANVRIVGFVSLNELLPTCSAVVHQGGYGTYSNAFTHGVPNIVIPHPFWDEAECGRVIEERGIGLCVPPEEFTPPAFRAALTRVLDDPGIRRAVDEVRREVLATPTPSAIVPELERLTAAHRAAVAV